MEDRIALVDLDDNITGYATKEEAHRRGLLHRAFSVFIINDGKMLIQMRNPDKYHSGGLWSNACHLEEKFSCIYRTQFRPDLIEYEFDHVFAGCYDGEIRVDPEEASETRWISFRDLKEELLRTPERFSSWFIICAPKVIAEYENAGRHSEGVI